ncbi:MAG: hypothetical protein K2J13_03725, partial [Clostridia bacterium]|nr:hypothetical protein [Clostridia bacterium]
VNPRDYSITVLFADSINGGFNSESIKGSYTVLGHTIVPQAKANADTIKYRYYNDTSDVSFDLENVYNKNIVSNAEWVDITIEGKKMPVGEQTEGDAITVAASKWSVDANNHKLTFNVSEVGDYTVKIKPKSGNSWADGTTGEKTYKYTLKYKLKPLAWDKNSSTTITETYNGGDQYLLLKNYDEDIAKLVTLTPTYATIPDGQTNAGRLAIKVKDYEDNDEVKVKLNNTNYMVWDETSYPTADKTLKYSVNKKELAFTPIISDWKMDANEQESDKRTFYLWVGGVCKEDDLSEISFKGYKKKGANGAEEEITDVSAPEFVKDVNGDYEKSDGKYKLKIILPKISDAGANYKYILKFTSTSSENYCLPMGDDKDRYENGFKVENKSLEIKDEDIV